MAKRGYPRFLFSDPKNVATPGPFIIHTIFPRMIFKINRLTEQGSFSLKLIEKWDETVEPFSDAFQKAENAVAWFASEWLTRQVKLGEINLSTKPYTVTIDTTGIKKLGEEFMKKTFRDPDQFK